MRPARLLREKLALRDGREVIIRPIDRDDAERLIDLHNHLSPDSQYYRFFGPKPRLSQAEAIYLAKVDFHQRFAIVAEVTEDEDKHIVGVGRFDINAPRTAEAAIVVRDDYHRVGLGTAILQRMREIAKGRGLKAFTAEILAENKGMLDLLGGAGLEVGTPQGGVVRVTTPIDQPVLFKGLQIVAHTAEALLDLRDGKKGAKS
jgi:RimJ/RimL family protein N-acetyltransferase